MGVTENCLISLKMELVGLSRVCNGNCHFIKVNDINDFEALKLVGSIEWELTILGFFKEFLFILLLINTLGIYISLFE